MINIANKDFSKKGFSFKSNLSNILFEIRLKNVCISGLVTWFYKVEHCLDGSYLESLIPAIENDLCQLIDSGKAETFTWNDQVYSHFYTVDLVEKLLDHTDQSIQFRLISNIDFINGDTDHDTKEIDLDDFVDIESQEAVDKNIKLTELYRYTHVLRFTGFLFDRFYFLTLIPNPLTDKNSVKRLRNKTITNNILELKRYSYFNHEGAIYYVGKVKESTRNVSKDEEFLRIVRFKHSPCSEEFDPSSIVPIIFDCETIQINNRHWPYIICAQAIENFWLNTINVFDQTDLHWNEQDLNKTDFMWSCSNMDIVQTNLGARRFVEWIQTFVTKWLVHYKQINLFNIIDEDSGEALDHQTLSITFRIIGFNNNNFDNHFILNELRSLRFFKMTTNQRLGKVTFARFSSTLNNKNIQMFIDINDITKYVPCSTLYNACKDFNIANSKINFDIVKYNQACMKEGEFLVFHDHPECYFKDEENEHVCEEPSAEQIIEDLEATDPLIDIMALNNTPPISKDVELIIQKFKKGFTYNLFDIVVEYCKIDVAATMELYLKLNNQSDNLFKILKNEHQIVLSRSHFMNYVSAPQMSFDIFKGLAIRNEASYLEVNNSEFSEFIYQSFFGGRTDFNLIGEYTAQDELYYMDVTSEYPTAMNALYPDVTQYELDPDIEHLQNQLDFLIAQRNIRFLNQDMDDVSYFKDMFCGFFKCHYVRPKNPNHLVTFAPIPRRKLDTSMNFEKLIYENSSQFNRVLNTVQMRTLIYAGWRIVLLQDKYNILFAKQTYLFRDFVSILGSMKTQYRSTNKTLAKLCKLMLNSCYGKLAQKPLANYHFQSTEGNGKSFDVLYNLKTKRNNWNSSMHYWASFILSYANWILFTTCFKLEAHYIYRQVPLEGRCGALLYCDTDSIIFDPKLCNPQMKFNINEAIGLFNEDLCEFETTWKREHEEVRIKKLIVIAKKAYCLLTEQNEIIDLKLKGVHKQTYAQFAYVELKKLLSTEFGSKSISFNSLVKKNGQLNDPNSMMFSNIDILKLISEDLVKKTVTRQQNLQILQPSNKDVLDVNKANLEQIPFNEYFSNYLVFTCSEIKT